MYHIIYARFNVYHLWPLVVKDNDEYSTWNNVLFCWGWYLMCLSPLINQMHRKCLTFTKVLPPPKSTDSWKYPTLTNHKHIHTTLVCLRATWGSVSWQSTLYLNSRRERDLNHQSFQQWMVSLRCLRLQSVDILWLQAKKECDVEAAGTGNGERGMWQKTMSRFAQMLKWWQSLRWVFVLKLAMDKTQTLAAIET